MEEERCNRRIADPYNSDTNNTLMEALGIRYSCISAEKTEAKMPVDERTTQPFGILHGGAVLALAETVAGAGSLCLCNPDQIPVGIQVSANHISSARKEDEYVKAIGTIIHNGKSSHVWNIDVFTSSGKLISTVRIVNSILIKRYDKQPDTAK